MKDTHLLTSLIRKEHPRRPLFLFGHSMGSFVSRCLIQRYGSEFDGVILSGTAADKRFLTSIGLFLANAMVKVRGAGARSRFLQALSFAGYNRGFKPNRTAFDWLSRDEKAVDAYVRDPYCGFVMSVGFFRDLFRGMKEMGDENHLAQIPKDLPAAAYFRSGRSGWKPGKRSLANVSFLSECGDAKAGDSPLRKGASRTSVRHEQRGRLS